MVGQLPYAGMVYNEAMSYLDFHVNEVRPRHCVELAFDGTSGGLGEAVVNLEGEYRLLGQKPPLLLPPVP